jgi:hypothetical protein
LHIGSLPSNLQRCKFFYCLIAKGKLWFTFKIPLYPPFSKGEFMGVPFPKGEIAGISLLKRAKYVPLFGKGG